MGGVVAKPNIHKGGINYSIHGNRQYQLRSSCLNSHTSIRACTHITRNLPHNGTPSDEHICHTRCTVGMDVMPKEPLTRHLGCSPRPQYHPGAGRI